MKNISNTFFVDHGYSQSAEFSARRLRPRDKHGIVDYYISVRANKRGDALAIYDHEGEALPVWDRYLHLEAMMKMLWREDAQAIMAGQRARLAAEDMSYTKNPWVEFDHWARFANEMGIKNVHQEIHDMEEAQQQIDDLYDFTVRQYGMNGDVYSLRDLAEDVYGAPSGLSEHELASWIECNEFDPD